MGSVLSRVGAELGPIWGRFGHPFGGRFGVDSGPVWGRCWADSGPNWGRFGVDLGARLGLILGLVYLAQDTQDVHTHEQPCPRYLRLGLIWGLKSTSEPHRVLIRLEVWGEGYVIHRGTPRFLIILGRLSQSNTYQHLWCSIEIIERRCCKGADQYCTKPFRFL